MTANRILITGADGYLGRLIVDQLLDTTDRPLVLWVRATDRAHALARCRAAFGSDITDGGRVVCTGGDLREPDPFGGIKRHEIAATAHLAAVTTFTVDAPTADAVNVEGTAKLLRFALGGDTPIPVCLASTLYVSGLTPGPVAEVEVATRPSFANHYERSKWEAERLAFDAARHQDLPLSVVRIATVLADDDTGTVGQDNAVHNTLQLLLHGMLTMVPGNPDTPVHLTTGSIAAAAVVAALDSGSGVYHAAAPADRTLTLGQALELADTAFGDDAGFARRRQRRPRFVDLRTFQLLAEAAQSMGGSVLGQAMGSLLPFAPQLSVSKQIATGRFQNLLDAETPDLAALFGATCRYLLERGGRRARAS